MKKLRIVQTCGACPEQYDVFLDDKQVGYMRLRHGYFYASVPDPSGEKVYESHDVSGDGIFDEHERGFYISNALDVIKNKLKEGSE